MTQPHPLAVRARAAVEGYRATGDAAHLQVLRQDGHRKVAHALTMERVLSDAQARQPYAAEVDAFLATLQGAT